VGPPHDDPEVLAADPFRSGAVWGIIGVGGRRGATFHHTSGARGPALRVLGSSPSAGAPVGFGVKHEVHVVWGLEGLEARLRHTDVYVIVDVLSFSTCVDVGVDRGAWIVPAPMGPDAYTMAETLGAECADARGTSRYSLSPPSIAKAPSGTTIVLPSANGALCLNTRGIPTLAGCLRNAAAVAGAAMQIGHRITIVAAGERWPNGALRPAIEDWIGAGAVVARMAAERSPEASAAQAGFGAVRSRLLANLLAAQSGQLLAEAGYAEDVRWAAELDANRRAPLLVDHTFLAVNP
jgi:2-phosphosulfolactate phosphatase